MYVSNTFTKRSYFKYLNNVRQICNSRSFNHLHLIITSIHAVVQCWEKAQQQRATAYCTLYQVVKPHNLRKSRIIICFYAWQTGESERGGSEKSSKQARARDGPWNAELRISDGGSWTPGHCSAAARVAAAVCAAPGAGILPARPDSALPAEDLEAPLPKAIVPSRRPRNASCCQGRSWQRMQYPYPILTVSGEGGR